VNDLGSERPPVHRPRGPTPSIERPGARFPEPPAYQSHPLAPARACANCAQPLVTRLATPRCWGCGRPLCADCFWRHGATPTEHRCAGCAAHGPTSPSSAWAPPAP